VTDRLGSGGPGCSLGSVCAEGGKSGVTHYRMGAMALLIRLAVLLYASACLARPCSCVAITANEAKKEAEVVFRGTITAFRNSDNGERFVVFRVIRVWKGNVSAIFEMPAFEETTACIGFWPSFLSIGNDLLVYASQQGSPPAYFTNICTRTALSKDSKDFEKLGRGKTPRAKKPTTE
jgi:hypothetical protein